MDSAMVGKSKHSQNISPKDRWFFLVIGVCVLFFLGGCSSLSHLQQLFTLKDVSEEQQSIGEYVQEKDARFQKLLEAVCSGNASLYFTREQILTEFGEPFSKQPLATDSVAAESWLYHQQTRYLRAPKVTLNFDEAGNLVTYDVSDCSSVSAKN